jgi:hypothetical protein
VPSDTKKDGDLVARRFTGKWLIVALSIAWLGWELFAAFGHDPGNWPLTEVVVSYVPWPITAAGIAVLCVWLPWHFWTNYREKATMVNPVSVPLSKTADARNRAWRTFAQGLGIDVVTAVAGAVTLPLNDVTWTRVYWVGVTSLAAKTAVQTAVAYVARRVVPPPSA